MRKAPVILKFSSLLALAFAGPLVFGFSNRVEHFKLHHGAGEARVEFSGTEGFVNYNGLVISASDVTMDLESGHGRRFFVCANFRADLKTGFFVCDNRDVRRDSFTLDRKLRLQVY